MWKGSCFYLLLAFFASFLCASEEEMSYPSEDLLVLEVRLSQYRLSEGMVAYRFHKNILIPLEEFSRLLQISITVDMEAESAKGWILKENRTFFLDKRNNTITIQGIQKSLDAYEVQFFDQDCYVDMQALEEWFPIDLKFQQSTQTLTILSKEPLPMELALKREKERERMLLRQGLSRKILGKNESPYELFTLPFLEGAYQTALKRGSENSWAQLLSVESAGDLAYFNQNSIALFNEDLGLYQARLTLSRHDPYNEMLGPLRASSIFLGDFYSKKIPLISSPVEGVGASISNFPLEHHAEFDAVTLRGNLSPDWEAELYRNDELLDFQRAGSDGEYLFENVRLLSGYNHLKVKLYGPMGQEREETYRYLMHSSLVRKGEFYYRLSSSKQGDKLLPVSKAVTSDDVRLGKMRHSVEVEYGLGSHHALSSRFVSFPDTSGKILHYMGAGLRSSLWGIFTQIDTAKQMDGGSAATFNAQSAWEGRSLSVKHSHFFDAYQSEQENNSQNLKSWASEIKYNDSFQVPFSTGHLQSRF